MNANVCSATDRHLKMSWHARAGSGEEIHSQAKEINLFFWGGGGGILI